MKTDTYRIGGMSCASCAAAVERVTKPLSGVSESHVNLATEKLTVTYNEALLSENEIVQAISAIGFTAEPDEKKKM